MTLANEECGKGLFPKCLICNAFQTYEGEHSGSTEFPDGSNKHRGNLNREKNFGRNGGRKKSSQFLMFGIQKKSLLLLIIP